MPDNALMPLSDLQEKLRARVKDAMFELLSPEAFDDFIKKTWESFVTGGTRKTTDSYGHKTETPYEAEIIGMIRDEMKKHVRAQVEAWGVEWSKGPDASAAAQTVFARLTELAADGFMKRLQHDIVDQAIAATMHAFNNRICSSCRRQGVPVGNCPGCGCYNT